MIYKVIFRDMDENVIYEKEHKSDDIKKLFYKILKDFGCNDKLSYKNKNGYDYGYVQYFETFARFDIY